MGFYDSEKNVNLYIDMAKGFDGKELIEDLKNYLPEQSTVLELGMGPGVDLEILAEHYDVTGTDYSTIFLDRFRQQHPETKLLQVDIKDIQIDTTFDAIYSNKVLHHLTKEELRDSLLQQKQILNPQGILFHSFWCGEGTEEMEGMLFTYHTQESLREIIGDLFEIVKIETYTEMEENDSLLVVLKKQVD